MLWPLALLVNFGIVGFAMQFLRQVRGPLGVQTGGTSGGTFKPQITGWGFLMIAIAFITFGFFFTYYASLPSALFPAVLLFLLMVGGIVLAYIFTGIRVQLYRFDFVILLLGIMTFVGLLIIELGVSIIVPAATTTTPQTGISNFWTLMFYFSAGVAEEAVFSLFLLSSLVNAFRFKLGATFAIVIDSAFFMLYHSAVINVIYANAIYQSESYLILLFVGGILLRSMFYLTRSFAVPALGHGMLNVFVTLVTLGLVAIPLGYGLVIAPMMITLPVGKWMVKKFW